MWGQNQNKKKKKNSQEVCSKCKLPKPIVNQTRRLCLSCNEDRLRAIRGEKKPKKLNSHSSKEKKRLESMHKMYAKIDSEREMVCSGCNSGNLKLEHSHILSQARFPLFKDKEWNIVYDCDLCHSKWESLDLDLISTLLNFEERMKIVKKYAPQLYNLILFKNQQKHEL